MSLKIVLIVLATLTFHLSTRCLVHAQQVDKPDSTERDYSSELPRIKPTSAENAMELFTVVEGFRIEQVAAEPLVVDPIAMAFDADGRLFVVEMRGYSEDEKDHLGRIRLLEDTDADGRFDKSTVFVEGLSWPTAVTCYDGGIFVGVAPDILYCKDTDGDNKADINKVIYSGFARSNVQGLVNTFKWGLDNRIHGATSSSGAALRRVDGDAVAAADSKPLQLRGRDFAIDPRTLDIEATSGGGQHGLSFNRWGDKFVCSNSNHIQHVRFEDRYVARNPYFAAPGPRASIATDGPQADVFRSSPVEPWRIVRTRLRVKGIVPGPVEGGGTAAGYFTGATGVTIFRGNAWPGTFLDWAIIGDVGSNLIHRKKLNVKGASFEAVRVDEKSEFVSSRDIWFRPVQFANAPDGGLYVADMYREVIEHPKSLHPVIKQHLDLTSGRDRGRIYRIVADGFEQPPAVKLRNAPIDRIVDTLEHDNGWHRETAARLLYERQDRAAVPLAETVAAKSKNPAGRIRALYAIDGMSALSADVVLTAMQDSNAHVREHAVRLSERLADDEPRVREQLYKMVTDGSFRVRYQLAFTLGELTGPRRRAALATLVKNDGGDSLMRIAIMSSLNRGAGELLVALANDGAFCSDATGRAWINQLAAQIGKQRRADDVAAVLGLLGSLGNADTATIQAIVQGLAAKPGSKLEEQLAAVTGGRAGELMKELLVAATRDAFDERIPVADRVAAIQRLRLGTLSDRTDLFAKLLAPSEPYEVQATAVATLAGFNDLEVAELVLEQWPELSPRLRTRAADVLFSRDAWLNSLLDAVANKSIPPGDLNPSRLQLLATHPDEQIRRRAADILARNQLGSRVDVLEAYSNVTRMDGDAERGRAVFKKTCAPCHQLEGVGHLLGPNLAAMRNRGAEAVLANVLAPNREVNPQYLNYALQTSDGRALTGMIAEETATSVTLKRADNATDTVLRVDIEALRSTGMSLMPEGMEKDVSPQAMADLIAYLQSVK